MHINRNYTLLGSDCKRFKLPLSWLTTYLFGEFSSNCIATSRISTILSPSNLKICTTLSHVCDGLNFIVEYVITRSPSSTIISISKLFSGKLSWFPAIPAMSSCLPGFVYWLWCVNGSQLNWSNANWISQAMIIVRNVRMISLWDMAYIVEDINYYDKSTCCFIKSTKKSCITQFVVRCPWISPR